MRSLRRSMISLFFYFAAFFLFPAAVLCQISSSTLTKYPDVLKLSSTFDPIIAAYWTGLPHHRRTPFSVSPDGKSAYLAFLDTTYNSVFVQQIDPTTFAAVGDAVVIAGAREAGGLVAQNDGFALLTTIIPSAGTADAPPNGYPIAKIIRYKDGTQAWVTPVNGPGVHVVDGLSATPDINGDLVYSETAGLYAAYFVVTAYTGDAAGHFGDSIQYVDDSGALKAVAGASSTWGCSHNTGIALEAADAAPFASICAEDHGAIWLNTDTQSMSGIKIANENTTNGASGEPMGGMSGSYSNLALFPNTSQYIFAWQSRGAVNLKADDWMGTGFTTCDPRWLNHNVAIAIAKDKSTLIGAQAISEVGAVSGDAQVNWITESNNTDHQNVRVATFNSGNALVTWEELSSPSCQPVPLGCTGTFSGTFFQQVDSTGQKVGDAFSASDVFVAGDIANVGGRLCWPYVDMKWDLSAPKANGTYVSSISFACVSLDGNTTSSTVTNAASTTSSLSSASATPAIQDEAVTTVSPSSVTNNNTLSAQNIATTINPATAKATGTNVSTPIAIPTASTEISVIPTTDASSSLATSDPFFITTSTPSFINIITLPTDVTITTRIAKHTRVRASAKTTTSIDATQSTEAASISTEPVASAIASNAGLISTSTPSFINIITLPTGFTTTTEATAPTGARTSTEATTSVKVATSIETETSTNAATSTKLASTSLLGSSASLIIISTLSFINIITLTTTAAATATEAAGTTTPANTIIPTETATISAITSSVDINTSDPFFITTSTPSFINIITLTTTNLPTAIAPSATQSDPPTTTVGTWGNCGDGTICASGHRCIAFRGGVSVCVPGRHGGRKHRNS